MIYTHADIHLYKHIYICSHALYSMSVHVHRFQWHWACTNMTHMLDLGRRPSHWMLPFSITCTGCSPALPACTLLLMHHLAISWSLCSLPVPIYIYAISVLQVPGSLINVKLPWSFLTLSHHVIFATCEGRGSCKQPNSTLRILCNLSFLPGVQSNRAFSNDTSFLEVSPPYQSTWQFGSILSCSDVIPKVPLRH